MRIGGGIKQQTLSIWLMALAQARSSILRGRTASRHLSTRVKTIASAVSVVITGDISVWRISSRRGVSVSEHRQDE